MLQLEFWLLYVGSFIVILGTLMLLRAGIHALYTRFYLSPLIEKLEKENAEELARLQTQTYQEFLLAELSDSAKWLQSVVKLGDHHRIPKIIGTMESLTLALGLEVGTSSRSLGR